MAYFSANGMDMDTGTDELEHYGVRGMKWGIRKYVNYDGSLTAEGKKKYGSKAGYESARAKRVQTAKKIAIGVGAGAAAAGGAYLAYRHFKSGNRIGVNKINNRIGSAKNFTYKNANAFTRSRGYAQRAANAARGAAGTAYGKARRAAGNAAGYAKAYGDRASRAAGAKFNDARRWADSHMGARYTELHSDRIGGPSHRGGAAYRGATKAAGAARSAFNSARGAAGRATSGARRAAGNAAGFARAYGERAGREAGARFNDARRWADSHMGARYKNIPNNRLGGSTVSRAAGAAYRAKQAGSKAADFAKSHASNAASWVRNDFTNNPGRYGAAVGAGLGTYLGGKFVQRYNSKSARANRARNKRRRSH